MNAEMIKKYRDNPLLAVEELLGIKLSFWQKTMWKLQNGSRILIDRNIRRRYKVNPDVWKYWNRYM